MSAVKASSQIQDIVEQIDRLIAEMNSLRSHVSSLGNLPAQPGSVREADYFGMWADREDMRNKSSRDWLSELRSQQWTHR